jgi:hypothetical protein
VGGVWCTPSMISPWPKTKRFPHFHQAFGGSGFGFRRGGESAGGLVGGGVVGGGATWASFFFSSSAFSHAAYVHSRANCSRLRNALRVGRLPKTGRRASGYASPMLSPRRTVLTHRKLTPRRGAPAVPGGEPFPMLPAPGATWRAAKPLPSSRGPLGVD